MITDTTFADLGVRAPLVSVLAAAGITLPFPIQVQTLPDTLAGRDVLGRGKTGSGKTLAFSIPLVTRLSAGKRRPSRPSGLVLAPTRELATQITATLEPLAAACNLRVTTIFGGVPQNRQVAALKEQIEDARMARRLVDERRLSQLKCAIRAEGTRLHAAVLALRDRALPSAPQAAARRRQQLLIDSSPLFRGEWDEISLLDDQTRAGVEEGCRHSR